MLKCPNTRGRMHTAGQQPRSVKLQVVNVSLLSSPAWFVGKSSGSAYPLANVARRILVRKPCARKSQFLCSSNAASFVPQPSEDKPKGNNGVFALVSFAAIALGGAYYLMATTPGLLLKDTLVNGPLGKSGFLAAFSLIFLSEIGDKTFFIAALLAMKLGRWMAFTGSLGALGVMTVISVSIGAVFSKVPDALKSSIPVGEIAGIVLLVVFGIKALRDGLKADEGNKADEEMEDAESAVKEAENSGRVSRKNAWSSFVEVATLIFIAEWGDRSMLATIALGAAQNPVGVAVGAVVGHAVATGIAVMGGAIAAKYISEKTINLTSGILFLVFAAATGYSML